MLCNMYTPLVPIVRNSTEERSAPSRKCAVIGNSAKEMRPAQRAGPALRQALRPGGPLADRSGCERGGG